MPEEAAGSRQPAAESRWLGLLWVSFTVAIVVAFLCSVRELSQYNVAQTPGMLHWAMSNRTFVWIAFDASLWQFLTVVLLLAAVVLRQKKGPRRKALALSVLGLVGLAVLELALEKYVFKPSMCYPRPQVGPGEGYMTQALYRFLDIVRISPAQVGGMVDATPSGFALRQTILFLSLIVALSGRKTLSTAGRRGLLWTGAACCCLVLVSRFLAGAHSLFDLGLGVVVGVMGFWIGYGLVAAVRGSLGYLENLVAPGMTCFIVLQFYCHNPVRWMLLGLATGVVVLITYGIRYLHPPAVRGG